MPMPQTVRAIVTLSVLALNLLFPKISTAQTSTDLISERPSNTYFSMKRTFQAMVDAGSIEPYFDQRPGGQVDLFDCKLGSDFLTLNHSDTRDVLAGNLADVAYRVVGLKWELRRLGYPSEIWEPALIALEKRQRFLALGGKASPHTGDYGQFEDAYAALEKLVETLNRYRGTQAPHLAPVVVEAGCGAGEIGVNVVTEPRSGRVWFIPAFFYELCRVQDINPNDPQICDRWREPVEGLLFEVAGDYNYQAQWPDGHTRRGRLSFTNLREGQTVVVRRQ